MSQAVSIHTTKHEITYLIAENLLVIVVHPSVVSTDVNTSKLNGSLPMSMNPTRATAFAVIKRLEASTQHVLGKGSAYWKSHETIHCRRSCIASLERSSQIPSLTTLSSSRKCIPIHVLFPHSNDAETKMVKYTVLSLQSNVAASVLSVSFVED